MVCIICIIANMGLFAIGFPGIPMGIAACCMGMELEALVDVDDARISVGVSLFFLAMITVSTGKESPDHWLFALKAYSEPSQISMTIGGFPPPPISLSAGQGRARKRTAAYRRCPDGGDAAREIWMGSKAQ